MSDCRAARQRSERSNSTNAPWLVARQASHAIMDGMDSIQQGAVEQRGPRQRCCTGCAR